MEQQRDRQGRLQMIQSRVNPSVPTVVADWFAYTWCSQMWGERLCGIEERLDSAKECYTPAEYDLYCKNMVLDAFKEFIVEQKNNL